MLKSIVSFCCNFFILAKDKFNWFAKLFKFLILQLINRKSLWLKFFFGLISSVKNSSLTKEIYDLLAGVSEGNLNNLANQLNLSFAKIKKLQQNDTIDFSIEKLSRLRDSIQSIKEIESGL